MRGRFQTWLWLWLSVLTSCQRLSSCGQQPIAELLAAHGQVTRDERGKENQWQPAPVGERFSWGDAVRTAATATAQLRVGKTGRVMVDGDTIIRFLDKRGTTPEAPSGFEVAAGRAVIESSADPLTIQTRGGTALLKPGTRLEVRPAADGDSYRVVMGSVTFTQDDQHTLNVQAGQAITIGIGVAVFEGHDDGTQANGPAASAQTAQADAQVPTDAATHDAAATATVVDAGAAPDAATPLAATRTEPEQQRQDAARPPLNSLNKAPDLVVAAGESSRVFDPAPPTVVGFRIGESCTDEVELVVDKRATVRGSDPIVAELPVGSHSYTVRCAGAPKNARLHGNVRVVRGDGARPLPKSAPRNTVELDGHKYRLMYQSLRPTITVAWVSPPTANQYVLTIESPNHRVANFPSDAPTYVLSSGELSDGTHVLFMTANDTHKTRTKSTTVNISFDNAAPATSIDLPRPQGFAASEPIEIRGVAIEGSRVWANGEALELSRDYRFSHTLAPQPDLHTLAIRIQHPQHGVRYYLRRVLSAQR